MVPPKITSLFLAPAARDIEARIVSLTDDLASKMVRGWWEDTALKEDFDEPPIDRHWDWTDLAIDFEGRLLGSEKIAIVTGDGQVQGAALVSVDPVESGLDPGESAVFLERLFTAPRNRPNLRRDESPYFLGVGIELLIWTVGLSRKQGCGGRIRLDSSPDAVSWYEKRGLKRLSIDHMLFEGVEYLPMELPVSAADVLLPPRRRRTGKKK